MDKRLDYLKKLQTTLVEFLDQLVDVFPFEASFIKARVFIQDQFPIEDAMNYIITSLLPHYDYVKNRDDRFFLDNNVLFSQIDGDKVNTFSTLWKSDLDDDTKNAIWAWFIKILSIAKKYSESFPLTA